MTAATSLISASARFSLVLNDELAPIVRDQRGKTWRSLPKPTADEYIDCAAQAQERWKTLRKAIRQEVRAQSARFEQAMIDGHRWEIGDWQQAIVGHLLLAALARRVLWAGYDAQGVLQDVFCLSEDLASTEQYATADPRRYAAIGIPTRQMLIDRDACVWVDLLATALQIIPLFAQASRPVYDLADDDAGGTMITRFASVPFRDGAIWQLCRQQWRSGGYEENDQQPFFLSCGALRARRSQP